MSNDDVSDYVWKCNLPQPKRYPPRVRQSGPPEGQDYFTLTEKHGRPIGVFEQHGREIPYRGKS